MSESRTFASPVTESAPSTTATEETSLITADSRVTQESLDSYRKDNRQPFTVKHFKLLDFHELQKKPELDIDGMVKDVEMFEQYIKDNIFYRGLKDDMSSYDFLINEILEKIGDIEVEDMGHKFKRVAEYARKNTDVEKSIKKKEVMELIQKYL